MRHIRRMRGGSQAQLMHCSDASFYVVKFRNNPQSSRILANELVGAMLAHAIGLPVPAVALVEVEQDLIDHTEELRIELTDGSVPCEAGLHFGSRFVVNPLSGKVWDYMPVAQLSRVRNLDTFLGVLVLDKWVSNTDSRQATFWRWTTERRYHVSFIDQGYCFNAEEWTFPDDPLRGVYALNEVYEGVRDWSSFEPWLTRVENIPEDLVWRIASLVPQMWYSDDWAAMERLVRHLIDRRQSVRSLIEGFRTSPRTPFPNWSQHSS